jgi:hypothetical protein
VSPRGHACLCDGKKRTDVEDSHDRWSTTIIESNDLGYYFYYYNLDRECIVQVTNDMDFDFEVCFAKPLQV